MTTATVYATLSAPDRAVLRRSAARLQGTCLPSSVGGRLRLALRELQILRDRNGKVAGFGSGGFVLTPAGWGIYCWGEEHQRQAHINGV